MNFGLYTAASGALANMHRMDTFANNLANIETAGFKPVISSLRQRDPVRQEDGVFNLPSNSMLERLGGGVMQMPPRIQWQQGAPQRTGLPLDVALDGPGFLVLDAGDNNPGEVRFSRDGRLTMNNSGTLVQRGTGLPVLDQDNRPITLTGGGQASISKDGQVIQDGKAIARLQTTTVADLTRLRPIGDGLFSAPKAVMEARTDSTNTAVIPGSIERSAVDPIKTMTDITAAERSISGSLRLIQLQDQLMDRAINTFGRMA